MEFENILLEYFSMFKICEQNGENDKNILKILDNNISVIAGKYIVNAKSILGVMSIFYEDNFKLEISYKNENEVENILKLLKRWVK